MRRQMLSRRGFSRFAACLAACLAISVALAGELPVEMRVRTIPD